MSGDVRMRTALALGALLSVPGVGLAALQPSPLAAEMGEPERAVAVIQAVSGTASRQDWLLRVVEAKVLWNLGRRDESRRLAGTAVELAPTEQKRSDIREHLAFILDPPAG